MATTGIIYRRDTKVNLVLDPPLVGEIVYATDTEEYGALVATVLTWRPHFQTFVETFTVADADLLYSVLAHTHSGTYEPADATILKDADIGINVEAYDADIVKAPLGVLPVLDGSNLTGISGGGAALPLDGDMKYTTISAMTYSAGTLTQITYATGNKSNYTYTGTDLTQITYTDVDGITVLLTLNYTYDIDGNLNTVTRV